MTAQRRRLPRLQRISRLEESRINPLIVDLAEITSRLHKLNQQAAEVSDQINKSTTLDRAGTLQDLLMRGAWIEKLQQQLSQLKQQIGSAERSRDEFIHRLAAQKSKVRGWESLIDHWKSELHREAETHESILATDLYLRKYSNGQLP